MLLDSALTEKAQAAAYIQYLNNKMSHTPSRPTGMSDDMYLLCTEGAGYSNIYSWWGGYKTIFDMLFKFMDDSDSRNIDKLGHRRWMLNPTMGKTGIGMAEYPSNGYGALYAFDSSGAGSQTYVAWPAQQMPIEYFSNNIAWSISTGQLENENAINVKLTRASDNKTWNINKTSGSDGELYVNNDCFGLLGCIIWKPAGINVHYNDIYHVHIDGAIEGSIDYDVIFSVLCHSQILL